jgi:hypothetical protein
LVKWRCFPAALEVMLGQLQMSPFCRYYQIPDGRIVSIRVSPNNADEWAIWLDDRMICAGFREQQAAATSARLHKFSSDLQTRLFAGVSVPEHLPSWSECREDALKEKLTLPNTPQPKVACRSQSRSRSISFLSHDS